MRGALFFVIVLGAVALGAWQWQSVPRAPTQFAAISGIARGAMTSTVTYVFDGDTIEVAGGERVRYIGMNAPEIAHGGNPAQCFGREATERNRELVLGKEVRLVPDVENRDKYGRLLRYVWAGGTFVDLELVKEGYARLLTIPPNTARMAELKGAEREARKVGRGLWGVCR